MVTFNGDLLLWKHSNSSITAFIGRNIDIYKKSKKDYDLYGSARYFSVFTTNNITNAGYELETVSHFSKGRIDIHLKKYFNAKFCL